MAGNDIEIILSTLKDFKDEVNGKLDKFENKFDTFAARCHEHEKRLNSCEHTIESVKEKVDSADEAEDERGRMKDKVIFTLTGIIMSGLGYVLVRMLEHLISKGGV